MLNKLCCNVIIIHYVATDPFYSCKLRFWKRCSPMCWMEELCCKYWKDAIDLQNNSYDKFCYFELQI